jgi:hypothetical protein
MHDFRICNERNTEVGKSSISMCYLPQVHLASNVVTNLNEQLMRKVQQVGTVIIAALTVDTRIVEM